MQNKIYFDTNIVIDICDDTRKHSQNSRNIISSFLQNELIELYISSDTISTLFYILKNRTKLSLDKAIKLVEYINEVFLVIPIDTQDIKGACNLCKKKKFNDYEDALQYVCAKKIDASTIFTNDRGFTKLDIDIKRTCTK